MKDQLNRGRKWLAITALALALGVTAHAQMFVYTNHNQGTFGRQNSTNLSRQYPSGAVGVDPLTGEMLVKAQVSVGSVTSTFPAGSTNATGALNLAPTNVIHAIIDSGATSGETTTLTNIYSRLANLISTNQQSHYALSNEVVLLKAEVSKLILTNAASLNEISNKLAGTLTTTGGGGSAGISNAITSFEIPITAVAYTAGQVAGGLCYWTNTGIAGKSVTLSQVWFTDRDNQKPNITLIPFSTHPAARAGDVAAYTNAQLPTMLGDMLYSVAPIRILSADWTTFNDAGVSKAFVSVPNLGRDWVAQSNNVPFLVIIDSAATYTQVTNLVIGASFQK